MFYVKTDEEKTEEILIDELKRIIYILKLDYKKNYKLYKDGVKDSEKYGAYFAEAQEDVFDVDFVCNDLKEFQEKTTEAILLVEEFIESHNGVLIKVYFDSVGIDEISSIILHYIEIMPPERFWHYLEVALKKAIKDIFQKKEIKGAKINFEPYLKFNHPFIKWSSGELPIKKMVEFVLPNEDFSEFF
jgi:hypothetical protein